MSLQTLDFEGGTQDAAITTTSSSPTLTTVSSSGVTYDAAAAWHGSYGAKFTSTGSAALLRYACNSNKTQSFAGGLTGPSGTPSVDITVGTLRRASGPALKIVWVHTSNDIRLIDGSSAYVTLGSGLTPGDRYWVALTMTVDTTATGGLTAKLFDSTGTQIGSTVSTTTADYGTDPIVASDLGITSPGASTSLSWDYVQFNDGSTTLIDPPANAAPTASVGPDQYVQAGATVTLSATGSDTDGTITSLTGAFTAYPGESAPTLSGSATDTGTASASLTQTATLTDVGSYVWTATATDDASGTGSAGTRIYVHPLSGTDTTIVAATSDDWTNEGGAADLATALSDSDADTYAQTPAGPNGEELRIVAGPLGGSVEIYLSGYQTAATPQITRTVTVYKNDGTTQIYQTSYELPTTDTETHISVDSAGLAMIPDDADKVGLVVTVADTSA